ncbi:MAG: hypothetical protein IIV40_04275 [Oscillospiraceae bacterium]|nr:hypothetical protein [Oscillospiraceae bacterium]
MLNNRENNIKTLIASIILVFLIAAFAVAGFMIFGGEVPAEEDRFPWITSDVAAKSGMLDGTYYNGEKNSAGSLSYKIAGEITVGSEDGKGDFKIENSGKDICLMKVKITVNGETVYETGYLTLYRLPGRWGTTHIMLVRSAPGKISRFLEMQIKRV